MLDELFSAKINDSRQWLLIRGAEQPKAVVLFVHGGPGYPLMWYSRAFDEHLLNDFTVVHWDQRAAGKSASENTPLETVSIDQIVSDGLVVAELIRNRCPHTPLILVGHSWGTIIAANMAGRRPHDFAAYLSIGTAASWLRGEQLRYNRLMQLAADRANSGVTRLLQTLGAPPYNTAAETARLGEAILKLVGFDWSMRQLTERELADAMLKNIEYSADEMHTAFDAIANNLNHLGPSLNSYVLADSVLRLDLPVYFAEGRHDLTTPVKLSREYFARLNAPAGKHWVEFEHSAHMSMYEEPQRFGELLRTITANL